MKPMKQPTLMSVSFTLTNLPVTITFPYWQVLSFMEDFPHMNMFA